jgi:mono/diheme cytochrome c family protein
MPKTLAVLALLITVLAACAPAPDAPTVSGFEALPVGDISRGETLFAERIGGQATCIGCHSLDGSRNVGPTVQGYGQVAAQRVSGQSAEQYTYESIVTPWVHLVPGYSNLMPAAYGQVMTPQDAADLTAYLLSL